MKHASIRTCRGWLMGGLFIGLFGTPTLVSAQALSFVHDEYYLGRGGNPPSLQEFSADPLKYLRSEYAYMALRARFASALGQDEVTDEEFRSLIVSDRIEVRACTGQIRTAGLVGDSRQSHAVRNCYADEQLIWLDVDAGEGENWVLVASQGCYNATWSYTPPPTPRPSRPVAPPPAEYTYQPGFGVHIDDVNICGCIDVPGVTVIVPGYTQKHVPGFGQEN